LTNYYSTDELLKQLDKQNEISEEKRKQLTKSVKIKERKIHQFKLNRKIVFIIALVAAIVHIFYVSIPLVTDNRGINAFGVTTILAVPDDQPLSNSLYARVVIIEKYDVGNYEAGDKIIVYGLYNTTMNWVVEIVTIDRVTHEAQITFDGVISHTINTSEIEGKYVRTANLMGIISYISSNVQGYIFLIGVYIIGFSLVYYFYIRKKPNKPIE